LAQAIWLKRDLPFPTSNPHPGLPVLTCLKPYRRVGQAMQALLILSALSVWTSFAHQLAGLKTTLRQVRQLHADESSASRMSPLAGCDGLECVKKYVALPDASFSWQDIGVRAQRTDFTAYVLNMTSQSWLPANATDLVAWWHPIVVIVPADLDTLHAADWATIYIGGAGVYNRDLQDPAALEHVADIASGVQLATRSRSIVAVLMQVPNQEIVFSDDPAKLHRWEDEIKAYSWRQGVDHPEQPEWPIEMPNVKAVVRAMDVLTAFSKKIELPLPKGSSLERFGLIGASKRGMAAYMTAAVDSRVKAIVPMVISMDHAVAMHQFFMQFGNLPSASKDYFDSGVFGFDGTSALDRVFRIIDPSRYMESLSLPKLVVMAGNDDFFPVDASHTWYSRLPGQSFFRMVPNSVHSMSSDEFLPSAVSFFRNFLLGADAPRIAWTLDDENGMVHVQQQSNHTPLMVRTWRAFTCDGRRRDFRMVNADTGLNCWRCGWQEGRKCHNLKVYWSSTPTEAVGPGAWTASVGALPAGRGWGAVFVELEYPGPDPDGPNWRLTSEVLISPKTYPFPDCQGAACAGTGLVLQQQNMSGKSPVVDS